VFFTLRDQFVLQKKTFVAELKKVVAKSRARVYFEQLILPFTTCHATNATIFDPHQSNQPIIALHFFNP